MSIEFIVFISEEVHLSAPVKILLCSEKRRTLSLRGFSVSFFSLFIEPIIFFAMLHLDCRNKCVVYAISMYTAICKIIRVLKE